MTYLLIASAVAGGILLFLLAGASGNTAFFSRHYPLLVVLNIALALALVGLVGYQLFLLARALRRRLFGSRLTLRFLVFFAVMALAPGALVYTVSVQFLTRSIESWFDVRVDSALEGGLSLGRVALDGILADLRRRAIGTSLELSVTPPAQVGAALNRLIDQGGVEEVVLVTSSGSIVASATTRPDRLVPEAPPAAILRQARQGQGYAAMEGRGASGLVARVVVPVAGVALADEPRLLQLIQPVPPALVASAEALQEGYNDYKELSLTRVGLKRIYILTLTLTLLFALFSAVALAFVLSRRLSAPLAALAAGTEAVARGDFSRRVAVTSADELGTLTRSFNSMTEQLDEAQRAADESRLEVENAKARLEGILANLSTGVLVLDPALRLEIANAGADRILDTDLTPLGGAPVDAWTGLPEVAAAIRDGFDADGGNWQRELERSEAGQILLIRGSTMPAESGGSRIVVFDDVTQLVAAQRATAWGEVARRLAHEIKNPLTPIQLSAERLAAKLAPKLEKDDAAVLRRATDTIIDQVAGLKRMVDEFREYARLPAPSLAPIDLNQLVSEVLAMYEHSKPRVVSRLAADLPRVRGDAAQLRQVIHNLVQNAQDALAEAADPRIELVTEHAGERVWLRVMDNGTGFPDALLKRVFEPYVTTKPKGTGLGLAIVKKIVDEHHGTVRIENRAESGAAVSVGLPLAKAA